MEAGTRLGYVTVAALLAISSWVTSAQAANFRTQNFIIQAPTPQLANAVGMAAEKYRRDLAIHWLGSELAPWPTPCPIQVIAGPNLAAQGVTTYNRAPVRDFQMEVVGTPERILDSVLPHEVTHTILATHFGRPLPRWADEGICTTVEHPAERNKHEAKLREFLRSRRGIAMNQLFLLTEYPSDVLPMYAQGYSVCRFLIEQQDARTFIEFLHGYMQHPSWTENIRKFYGYDSLAELQQYWLAWVSEGSGSVDKFVKAATTTSPADMTESTVGQGSVAASPRTVLAGNLTPAEPLASLASASQAGWYARQRDGAIQPSAGAVAQASSNDRAAATSTSGGAIRAITPPSVAQSGPYSAAQPQPEQQISRQGVPLGDARGSWESTQWR